MHDWQHFLHTTHKLTNQVSPILSKSICFYNKIDTFRLLYPNKVLFITVFCWCHVSVPVMPPALCGTILSLPEGPELCIAIVKYSLYTIKQHNFQICLEIRKPMLSIVTYLHNIREGRNIFLSQWSIGRFFTVSRIRSSYLSPEIYFLYFLFWLLWPKLISHL